MTSRSSNPAEPTKLQNSAPPDPHECADKCATSVPERLVLYGEARPRPPTLRPRPQKTPKILHSPGAELFGRNPGRSEASPKHSPPFCLSAPLAGNRTARKLQNFSKKVKKSKSFWLFGFSTFSTFRFFRIFRFFLLFEQKSPYIWSKIVKSDFWGNFLTNNLLLRKIVGIFYTS